MSGKTSASSAGLPNPRAKRVSSCRRRWSCKASTTISGRLTSRTPLLLLGVLNLMPALVSSIASQILICLSAESRSTLHHRSASNSPRRTPVNNAVITGAYIAWPVSRSTMSLTWSRSSTTISSASTFGGCSAAATFRTINSAPASYRGYPMKNASNAAQTMKFIYGNASRETNNGGLNISKNRPPALKRPNAKPLLPLPRPIVRHGNSVPMKSRVRPGNESCGTCG